MVLSQNLVLINVSVLVPIIKNKNVRDVSNYRPIALTTVVSKLFESYMLHHLIDFLKTNNNQFWFKPNHGTDMSVFLLKQVASSYVSRDTPVFAVFLDAFKAFDKVDHDLLFKKLILKNVSLYFIRLLRYWYKTQMMKVRWNNYFSDSFLVSNGVHQGGILRPYLFSLYIDDLTSNLNTIKFGCYVGNYCLNHLMFADDICLFRPSLVGLQDLLNACFNYAQSHKMLFNCNKSFGMLFAPKNFNLSSSPKLLMDNSEISFFQSVKYLGLHISSHLTDDIDIQRQVKSLYCSANKLKQQV